MNKDTKASPSFFNPKAIGKSLKQVTFDLIQTDNHAELIGQWYHSEATADLYTWSDVKQNIIKQQLTFHGLVAEWNCLDGVKTGFVIETDMGQETKAISENVAFDTSPLKRTIETAIEILSNMDGDTKYLEQIIENFKNPQNIKTMKPDAFIQKFGLALKNNTKSNESFWESIRKAFAGLWK